jgi:hypothetical protein
MRARSRDAIAVTVLVLAALAALLAWHPLGQWAALAVGLGGVLVAAAVYRSARPLLATSEQLRPEAVEPQESASTPRPAAVPRGRS